MGGLGNPELAGSWFPDAFIGPMSNLQRFVSGEDTVLLTHVDDVLNTDATGGSGL